MIQSKARRTAIALVKIFRGDNELGLTLKTKLGNRPSPWMEELEIVVDGEQT